MKVNYLSGPKVTKLFSCSTHLSMIFIMLINMLKNIKMSTIVGISTFISRINTTPENIKSRKIYVF